MDANERQCSLVRTNNSFELKPVFTKIYEYTKFYLRAF
jgi:hypothetical protein